jgi:glycosyltransferase involved in cell wall biosynthesis
MSAIVIEDGFRIAVLLPCRNRATSIGGIVRGFATALPGAEIFVYDNNSTDDTARAATRAGARVYREQRQGKGNVVRRMFADIEADIYVLAEGDESCDPADAPSLVNALITERADMAVGTRVGSKLAERSHGTSGLLGRLYRRSIDANFTDVSSSYRALTRRFVKSFPAITTGFAIETELSMHASQLMVPVAEIELSDGVPRNTPSPAHTHEALRLAGSLLLLTRETRPFVFYAAIAMLFWIAGLAPAASGLASWSSGTAVNAPALAVAAGLFVIGFVVAACGLVLDSIARSRIEQKRILFLSVPKLGTQ